MTSANGSAPPERACPGCLEPLARKASRIDRARSYILTPAGDIVRQSVCAACAARALLIVPPAEVIT